MKISPNRPSCIISTVAWVGIIVGLLGLVTTVLSITKGGADLLHLASQAGMFVIVLFGSVGALVRCGG
jgi:hypothetical protein